jgi:sugar phosphate isomerase/epimerase
MNEMKNPLGVSIGVYPTEALFAEIAAAGITHIELSPRDEDYSRLFEEHESIRAMAERHGLTLWSLHLPFGRESMNLCAPDEEERKRTLAAQIENLHGVHALGIDKVIVHGGIPLPQTERKKYFEIAKDNIRILQEAASRLGIAVCVETLMPSCIGRNSSEILEILSAHPDLRVCLDANHLLGENHADLIRRLGNRIVTTHISDYDFIDERHWLPGEGRIDWPLIMKTLFEVGYEGPILYEANPWITPKTITRRPLTLSDYRENYEALMRGECPAPIGTPNEEVCRSIVFAERYFKNFGVKYEA